MVVVLCIGTAHYRFSVTLKLSKMEHLGYILANGDKDGSFLIGFLENIGSPYYGERKEAMFFVSLEEAQEMASHTGDIPVTEKR